jgi:hypothetical protein
MKFIGWEVTLREFEIGFLPFDSVWLVFFQKNPYVLG